MRDDRPTTEISVLIVGGGPIGLALAADLGRRGVEVLLVEKRSEKMNSAKMLEVGVRTMEFCRQLGLAEEVRNWGFPHSRPLDSVFVTNLNGFEIGRIPLPSLGTHRASAYSPERTTLCPQTWFDPILKHCATSFPNVQIRHEVALEDFTQDAEGVTSVLWNTRGNRREIVRSAYLIGCDGADSTVRDRLGIEVRGQTHLDWSMNIYFDFPDFDRLHHTRQALRYVFVGREGSWSFLTAIDGKNLFRLQLIGVDREKLDGMDIKAIVRRCFGRSVPYTVVDKNLWVRRMTVADRFMDGRVFLAGDAGHAHPPNGGLGMNTGIQDSFDLGWKLAAVLAGWGGPLLLDSYDYERRPASARATQTSLTNYRRLQDGSANASIEAEGPEGEAARRTVGDLLVKENKKSWQPPGAHLGHIYSPSLIVVGDQSPRPVDDTFGYVPTAYPGARAPHVWLRPDLSIIDLFGQGFALLSFADTPVEELQDAARRRDVPLETHRILNPQAAELYGRKLVLVRPDGHVAWRDDALPEDCLALIDTVRGAGLRAAARRASDEYLAPSTERRLPGTQLDANVLRYRSRDRIAGNG